MTENTEISLDNTPVTVEETTQTKAVSIVTIKNKIALSKGDEVANKIELIEVEEHGFQVVSQKDLYKIGDKAIFIQPDHSLSDIPLFESFIAPDGDPKKSRLGSRNRIRAIKFNLHTGNGMPTYSEGILLPYDEVKAQISDLKGVKLTDVSLEDLDLVNELKITKWEEAEKGLQGPNVKSGATRSFPEGVYKTDEENFKNVQGRVLYPFHGVGSLKVDGSSTSIGHIGRPIICSRNNEIALTHRKVVARREITFIEKIVRFFTGKGPDLNIYQEVESDSDFYIHGKDAMGRISGYCQKNGVNLILRGELNGQHLKGSGNKNNPSAKDKPNIKFFGLDEYIGGIARKQGEVRLQEVLDHLGLERAPVIFNQEFQSHEELMQVCTEYFAKNLVEGIVIRSLDHTFSAKIMNPEYDSKK